jgi:hypothetical protein
MLARSLAHPRVRLRFRTQAVGAASRWVEQVLQPCTLYALHNSRALALEDSFKFLTLAQPKQEGLL